MANKVSPLAPDMFPDLPAIDGVRLAAVEAGIRGAGRKDVLLAVFDEAATVGGVFTQSKCPSAPVDWCRENLANGRARALLVNSGNANAFTGKKGVEATKHSALLTAQDVGCAPSDVFLASTGVIGEPLDANKFSAVLSTLKESARPDNWQDAARAIMTTDTFPKAATRTVKLGNVPVTINGIAKGSGMIAPDMATMLSFIFTDAPVNATVLQSCLSKMVGDSFNAVTVDSDTSTSDTVLFFATGKAADRGAPEINDYGDRRLTAFKAALKDIMSDLAQQLVRDGEGASKFITIDVTGATSKQSAKKIAMSIANSPLVKTAIAGEDANWGRIVMAVGKAGEPADRDLLAIWFGDFRVAYHGERDEAYSEDKVSQYMKGQNIHVRVDLGLGRGAARVWTCDLTHDYISINADYRS